MTHPPTADHPWQQLFWLLILAIPIACVARTVVFEEIFREPREWCHDRSQMCRKLFERKFFYIFTCEYCFSHYVTLFFIWFTGFKLLLDDWRGYVLAFFALVFVANSYLNLYGRLRLDMTQVKSETKRIDKEAEKVEVEARVMEREVGEEVGPRRRVG